jgi:hypothetical protein
MLVFNGNDDEIGRRSTVFRGEDGNMVGFVVDHHSRPPEPFYTLPAGYKGDASGIHVMKHGRIDRPQRAGPDDRNGLDGWFHNPPQLTFPRGSATRTSFLTYFHRISIKSGSSHRIRLHGEKALHNRRKMVRKRRIKDFSHFPKLD